MTGNYDVRVPPRYARVNAWVISGDTDEEVRFLTSVFGAVEGGRQTLGRLDAYVVQEAIA